MNRVRIVALLLIDALDPDTLYEPVRRDPLELLVARHVFHRPVRSIPRTSNRHDPTPLNLVPYIIQLVALVDVDAPPVLAPRIVDLLLRFARRYDALSPLSVSGNVFILVAHA
jgi:hypothetical protein